MIRWLQQLRIRFRRWQDNREIVALRQDIRYHEYAERRHRHIAYHLTCELYNKQKNKITDTRSMMARLNRLDDFEKAEQTRQKVRDVLTEARAEYRKFNNPPVGQEAAADRAGKILYMDRVRRYLKNGD